MRLGIVGLGRGATLTVPAFAAHPRIEVVVGTDPNAAACAGFTHATGARTVANAAAMFADPSIDAVYIASPHELHAAQAIAAAQRGKHVLVEKPMAIALADAHAMIAAAAGADVVLMVGPSHGYDPPVALAADLIANEAGPARLIHAVNYSDFLDRPRRPEELDRTLGGGVVFSQASHQIDVVRRLAASPVATIRGWVGGWHATRTTDGAYSALLTFENGAAASLTYSGHGRYDSDALVGWVGEMGQPKRPDGPQRRSDATKASRGFAGVAMLPDPPTHHERFGFVVASCAYADLELTPDGFILHDPHGTASRLAPLPPVQRYAVADAFACAVLDGAPALFDGRWGLETLACCHAILRSADDGRDVAPADLIRDLETR